MTLFGILPAAMAWRQRSDAAAHVTPPAVTVSLEEAGFSRIEALPGGLPLVGAVGGMASAIILYELLKAVHVLA
jgi:hypothetical protein